MSIVQQLSTDLLTLSGESKRRNSDIRHASEKSLEILKAYQPSSDEQLFLKSLSQNSEFINPFLLSCQSRNAKFTAIALQCLSKLILSQSLPVTKLDIIIDSLLESTHSSIEIQLKILQLLPSFFQNYSMFIADESLSKLLLVCSSLQSANKMGAVINTAQATFLQLINIVFEKVIEEDKKSSDTSETLVFEVPCDINQNIKVGACAYDSQRIVNDLCTLIEHHKPSYLKTNYITEDFGFELLESIIKNNQNLFVGHPELAHLLRIRVAPTLLRFLSSSKDFTVMVRVSRLMFLLIHDEFAVLKIESEVTLSLLTHTLLKESASPTWKKVLALEIYNGIFKDFDLTRKIFMEYDNNQEEERKKVLEDFFKTCFLIVNDNKQLLNTGDLVQPSPSSAGSASGSGSAPSSAGSSINTIRSKSTPSIPASPTTLRQQQEEKKHGLSIAKSSVKMAYIESLDKADPPPIPETYQLYLIFQSMMYLSEGICKHALDLASNTIMDSEGSTTTLQFLADDSFNDDTETTKKLKEEYNCIKCMISLNASRLVAIYTIFMHSTLDNDLFSRLIRSLQRLCHASGILSINDTRNDILLFFAKSTLNLTGKQGFQNKILSFGESLVGTISSTIGNAVSNISHNTSHTDGSVPPSSSMQQVHLYTRNINSRQILCFRVLISLATSLGAILEDQWEIILITVQWISYYIDGPSDLKVKEIPSISPLLANNDLGSVEASLKKLMDGINTQTPTVYHHVLNSLATLSNKVLKTPLNNEDLFGHGPINKAGQLEAGLFNKSFYINKLTDICEVSPLKFLIETDENWNFINDFLVKLACDRTLDDDTRSLITRNFDTIIKSTAVAGFDASSEKSDTSLDINQKIRLETERKVLTSLHRFIVSLSTLPISNEVLVTNCEVAMQLQIFNTLKSVIERFGNIIQYYWNVVTAMLNSPFGVIATADAGVLQEKAVNEVITSVLKSTFETLKVILDEILQSIPINQIKVIIDCLYNFVTQKFDMNISFNSISYFWLISDYLKDKIESKKQDGIVDSNDDIEKRVVSEESLIKEVSNESSNEVDLYKCLWIYLILKLSTTTKDARTQVRNGSIMTFFNVIDSYGTQSPSWALIYKIILSPVIMTIQPPSNITSLKDSEQKEWIESFTHIINGLSKVFSQYMNNFEGSNQKETISFWKGLIEYFAKMSNLELNWIELNLQIFKSYENLLNSFVNKEGEPNELPTELIDQFYSFWSNFQISYNLSNDSLYQESLSAFISSFDPLFKLLQPVFTLNKLELILTIFNSCIRYPILIGNTRDDLRLTNLQSQVLNNLAKLKFKDPKFESLLIQQLNLIVVLPFSTRDLIQKKLGDRGIKIPTFIAASYKAIALLQQHIDTIDDLTPIINDKCILRVYKALLEPSKLKSDEFRHEGKNSLWMESLETLTKLSSRICRVLSNPDIEPKIKPEIKSQLWPLILDTFKTCFIYSNDIESKEYEEFDILQYEELKTSLVPLFSQDSIVSNTILEEFIVTIWTSSFLYTLDEIENSILESSKSPIEVSKKLSEFDFDLTFGSTLEIKKLPRLKFSKTCLNDLISFSVPSSTTSTHSLLFEKSLSYFISRCSFVLRKFLSDMQLLNKEPLPRIQQVEIRLVLSGLVSIMKALDTVDFDKERSKDIYSKLVVLYPLLVKSISVDSRVHGVADLVKSICVNFGKNAI